MLFLFFFLGFGANQLLNKNVILSSESNDINPKLASSDNEEEEIQCGNNAEEGPKGMCHCVKNYPLGDPYSPAGCFRCNTPCHQNATCQGPDICVCKDGMLGDGVKSCEAPTPEIYKLEPEMINGKGNDTVTILYQLNTNFYPKDVFCKFSNLVVRGRITPSSEIVCLSPPIPGRSTMVSISFNNKTWSKNGKQVIVQQKLSKKKILFDFVACLFIFSGVPSYFRTNCASTNGGGGGDFDIITNEEREPMLRKNRENLFEEFN